MTRPKSAPKSAAASAAKPAAAPAAKSAPAKAAAAPAAAPTDGLEVAGLTIPSLSALPVREGDDAWTVEEVAELVETLQADVARLLGDIASGEEDLAELVADAIGVGGEDQADAGSKAYEREHALSLVDTHRELLRQTEHALYQLQHGRYGSCEVCGQPIGKARLQAYPRAAMCVRCKQRQERR